MKITRRKKVSASNYVPDMTQRYPEGENEYGPYYVEGYEPDYDELMMDPDEHFETLGEAFEDIVDNVLNGNWTSVTIEDLDGTTYYAEPNSLDSIPEYVMNKPVDVTGWNTGTGEIKLTVLDL